MSGRAAVCGPSIKHYDFNYHPCPHQPNCSLLIWCIGLRAGRIKGGEKNTAVAQGKNKMHQLENVQSGPCVLVWSVNMLNQ